MKIPKLTAKHFALKAFALHANKNDQNKMGLPHVMPGGCNEDDYDAVQKEMVKMGREFERRAKMIKPY